MMIYCVAIAGIWQTSGFVMAMFLAGLRGVDGEILKAAQIDGASAFQTYRRIVIPIMRPVFFSAMIVLAHMAIKSYDLVLSVTGKNPGGAAELPSTFMYSYTFTRNQMAVGSTSAVIMLMTIAAIMVPYLYSETEGEEPMSAADLVTAPPSREPARHSLTTRVVIYGLLIFFAVIYLVPLVVMVMTSLKPLDEVTGGNMFALPQAPDLRAVGQGLGRGAHRRLRDAGHQGLLLELDQDGRAGGADLDAARRAQRLCADQVALPRPQAGVRHDAVRLLHPVPVGASFRWRSSSASSAASATRCTTRPAIRFGFGNPTVNLVIVHVVYGLGFTTLFFRNYYEAFPTELVKAAMIDGASFFQIFRRVLLPNSTPIFIVTVIYQFTNIWNDFLFGSTFAAGDSVADDGGAQQSRQHLDRASSNTTSTWPRRSSPRRRRSSSMSSPDAISCAA